MTNKTRSIKTKDSYEASYYLMFGGKFVKLRECPLYGKKRERKGFAKQWMIYLKDVPAWVIESWRQGFAYGSIKEFTYQRKRLKKLLG